MEKRVFLIVVFILFLALPVHADEGAFFKKGSWELGIFADFRSVKVDDDKIPQAVWDEAANPSIVNPHSGRLFGPEEIGTYDPNDKNLPLLELGVYGSWIMPLKLAFKPYLRLDIGYPVITGNDSGSYGEGYNYENVLGSGVDYVRYVQGGDIRNPWYVKPWFGFVYNNDKGEFPFRVSLGASYHPLEIEWKKGIEAWGDTESQETLDSEEFNVWEIKGSFGLGGGTDGNPFVFTLEPTYTGGDGISAWGIGASIGLKR